MSAGALHTWCDGCQALRALHCIITAYAARDCLSQHLFTLKKKLDVGSRCCSPSVYPYSRMVHANVMVLHSRALTRSGSYMHKKSWQSITRREHALMCVHMLSRKFVS
jgi:hypothetical protein